MNKTALTGIPVQLLKGRRHGVQPAGATAFALIIIACWSAASGQALGQQTVTSVEFTGLERTSNSFAQSIVQTHTGDAYDPATVEADVTRLLATGRFAAVTQHTEERGGGIAVIFDIQERIAIREIGFIGNEKYNDKKLREQVPLRVGDPLDTFSVREGADAITAIYRDAGYGEVVVTYNEDLLRDTGDLVYTIEEGPRIRVRDIEFEGNDSISDVELRKHIGTKTYLWIFRDGQFDQDAVEADAAAVQSFYRREGYLDARVGYRLDYAANQQDLTVTFTIAEGERYYVEAIDFEGNTVMTDEELSTLCSLAVGGPMLQNRLDDAARDIQSAYGERGYIYASVRPVRVFSETPQFVLITINIEEGDLYRVGRIDVRGNERTQDKVVRREFDLYPNDVFNTAKVREAEDALRRTQLFGLASIAPVGDAPGVRDVQITVEESRKAGDFLFGFGVTSNSGLVGSVMLDIKNFDLFDPPRNLEEFYKLRSFHGAGQRLRIEAQPGTELNRFRVDFTEPYLFDKPLRFDFSAYFFERGREEYNERRIGSTVSLGKRLTKGPLKDWYGELAFRIESVRLDSLEVLSARDIRDAEGSDFQTSLKATLIRDRTDNRFLPTRGDRWRFAYEQFGVLGGENYMGKLTGGYAWHTTLFVDEQERKHVLSLKSDVGLLIGDTPVYERFYAGGIGSIRGFQFRGVTPRQGLRDDAVGGDFMILGSAEYSYPLYGDMFRGLIFTDMGTVEESLKVTGWRASVGTGVRLQIDFFGPVPLEFDVAVPVLREGEDEEQVFSFFIGATF